MMPNPITAASESITVNEMADRYRSLVEDTSDGFYSFDADSSRFVFMNGRSLDFLGYSDKEVKKLRAWEIIVPVERHLFKKRLRTLLKGKRLKPERCVYTALRKDLTTLNVEMSKAVAVYNGRPFVQGVLRDVTNYERYRKQIDHIRRMETITAMVGGLTKQFVNAIGVIRSNCQRLGELNGNDESLTPHLAQIKGALNHIDGLTNHLLAFSYGGDPASEIVSPYEVLAKILPLIIYSIPHRISIKTEVSEDLPFVNIDVSHLQMILSAIIANAEKAIEGCGRILIMARKTDPEPGFFEVNTGLKPGNYVCLSVEDNGKGMDEQIRRRVCEPFFTTKLNSRGLGMAEVYRMVKNQGGWLSIQNNPKQGTTVSIYLPAVMQMTGFRKNKTTPNCPRRSAQNWG